MSNGVAPAAVCAHVLVPTTPDTVNAAPIACRLSPSPHVTWVFAMFSAVPLASATSPLSTAAIAARTSSSGDDVGFADPARAHGVAKIDSTGGRSARALTTRLWVT